MRYQVPQFIEVEDKIFGPLSFKQFAYLAGAVGFVIITYSYLGLFGAIILGGPFVVLGALLAFYKVNNRPFSETLRAILQYSLNKRLYIWSHERTKKKIQRQATVETAIKPVAPRNAQNRLKDLAWSLDIKESMYDNQGQTK